MPNRKVGEEAQQTISQKKKYRWLIKLEGKKVQAHSVMNVNLHEINLAYLS